MDANRDRADSERDVEGCDVLWLEKEKRKEMKEKRTERRKLLLCCCCGCSRRDTVPSTLQWERLPEQQQRTQEEPAPCELGLSAPHGQEKAAQTHTFKHRQTHTHTHSTLHTRAAAATTIPLVLF